MYCIPYSGLFSRGNFKFRELNVICENFPLRKCSIIIHSICALLCSNIGFAEVISEETCLLEIGTW